MKKTLLFSLLACVSIATASAILHAVQASDTQPQNAPPQEEPAYPPIKVALAEAGYRRIPRAFTGVGELEALRQVQVAAEAGGKIVRIAFESGQRVERGQALVQLNDAVEQAELVRLRAQLRKAEAAYGRTRELHGQQAVSRDQLDDALSARDMARAAVAKTQALIEQKTITAPFAGVMGIRRVHLGQYLDTADPVANLVDASTLRANFALSEQSTSGLSVGQSVEVEVDAFSGQRFAAQVTAIDPLISAARTVLVQATLDNPGGQLNAGMYASIRVRRPDDEPRLTIPETAITYSAYGDTVFVAAPGRDGELRVSRVAVTTGERRDGRVVISEGLEAGDRVVTSGQIRLSDGAAVEAMATDTLGSTLPIQSAVTF